MLPIWEDIIVPEAQVAASNVVVDCIFLDKLSIIH
jgi:hypothetical protein